MYKLKAILTPCSRYGGQLKGYTEKYGLIFENKSLPVRISITVGDIQSWTWETSNLAEIIFIDSEKDERGFFLQQSRRDPEVMRAEGMFLRLQNMKSDEINHQAWLQGCLF